MNFKVITLFLLILSAMTLSACAKKQLSAMEMTTNDFRTQAEQFKKLSSIKGHFSGGDWTPSVDSYGGEKHKLMQQIGDMLVQKNMSVETVISYLGKPLEQTEDYLDYSWRGERDRLRLWLESEKVIRQEWLYTHEN